MAMTKKDYELVARVIKDVDHITDSKRMALAKDFARALSDAGGYDRNGNRRFKTDVFLKACGVFA